MNEVVTDTAFSLISCPSCQKSISVDASACPHCGGQNAWMHPTLVCVIDQLGTLDHTTEYESGGHKLHLSASVQNTRQQIGTFCFFGAVGLALIGLFTPVLMGLAVLLLCLGCLLTGFGMSFANHHELVIDLRTPKKVVGAYDAAFWADVLSIIQTSDDARS
ncbi:MAG: hypothetical protein ACSHXB_04885 [Sulfitobacter sp.]